MRPAEAAFVAVRILALFLVARAAVLAAHLTVWWPDPRTRLLPPAAYLLAAVVLWIGAGRIAGALLGGWPLPRENTPPGMPSGTPLAARAILRIAVPLIGLFLIVSGVPPATRAVAQFATSFSVLVDTFPDAAPLIRRTALVEFAWGAGAVAAGLILAASPWVAEILDRRHGAALARADTRAAAGRTPLERMRADTDPDPGGDAHERGGRKDVGAEDGTGDGPPAPGAPPGRQDGP